MLSLYNICNILHSKELLKSNKNEKLIARWIKDIVPDSQWALGKSSVHSPFPFIIYHVLSRWNWGHWCFCHIQCCGICGSCHYGWGFRGPSHGCLYSWRDGVTDLTVDAHLLWLWVPLWLGSQSHGHHLLLLGSLGLCYHLLWPGCKGYDGIVATVSAVPQFCLLYGFQFTLFKMKRWVKFSDMLVCLAEAPCWPVAVLLVINWRGKIQGAFHSAMMLMWFPFLNSYYQFSFHHIHQRVFPR